MAKTQSKVLAVALCATAIGGLFLAPSASAASDLGGKFMVKATNAQESQFWGIRGWHAPGKGTGGSGEGSGTGGSTPGAPGSGTGGDAGTPGTGTGGSGGETTDPDSGGSSSTDPGGLPYTGEPGLASYSAPNSFWTDMVYGQGQYLALSYYDMVASSTDEGKSWTTHDLPSGGNWRGLAYGSTRYVAVGGAGNIISSTDGKSWSEANHPAGDYTFQGVSYGNGTFVAVGADSSGSVILLSTDGKDWSKTPLPANFYAGDSRTVSLTGVQFQAGKFYAQSGAAFDDAKQEWRTALSMSSSDGKNWSFDGNISGTEFGWVKNGSSEVLSRDRVIRTSDGLIQGAVNPAADNSLVSSIDGGKSWKEIPKNGLPQDGNILFSSGGKLIAAAGSSDNPYDYSELYSSSDSGKSWKLVPDSRFMGSPLFNYMANATHGNCTVVLPITSDSSIRYCS